jgi:[lysine-biosynthesis-protein LysW]---L-2-aminoadipate ligase
VDLVETDAGLKVIEINVGAEFHGLMETTEVDIAGEILDYVVSKARQGRGAPVRIPAERGAE